MVLREQHIPTRGRKKKMFCCYGGTPLLIIKQLGPTMLRLKNLETNEIIPTVNVKTVRRFHGWDDTLPTPSPLSHSSGHHIIDIMDHRKEPDGTLLFKVRYSGFSAHSSKHFKWLDEHEIKDDELVLFYKRTNNIAQESINKVPPSPHTLDYESNA